MESQPRPMTQPARLNVADGSPLDLLASRRSVLAAQLVEPGPAPEELDAMLAIALRVPDHGRLAPWRLLVLSRPAQAQLGELFVAEFRKLEPDADDRRLALERVRPQRSPVLVAVASRLTDAREDVPPLEQLLSCGNVCFNLLHAATAMGYGAQWVTNWPSRNPAVKAALGIGEGDRLVGFVHIGTPRAAPAERQRPALAEVVSRLDRLAPAAAP